MRIAIVYDCLHPHTVGGAERWYRSLAERLQRRHGVTYLTRRQWGDEGPGTPFEAIAVAPGGELYTSSGRRRIWPPLRFGLGAFLHLLRHGRTYDAVHTASFPYFSVLGVALALRLTRSRARLVVDWHELWSREYWRSYLGGAAGRVGFAIQSLCLRMPDRSFTFSRLVEERLREQSHRAPVVRLTGEFARDEETRRRLIRTKTEQGDPFVLAAGRHIPEKRMSAVPPAVAAARRELPQLRCLILGDGPERAAVEASVRELGLDAAIELRGRVPPEEVAMAVADAACLLHPSEREGYGLVVVEAMSVGTPSILVEGPENAATELIESGMNGFIAASRNPRSSGV